MPLALHPEMTGHPAEIRWIIPAHPGNLELLVSHPESPLTALVQAGVLESAQGTAGAISTIAPARKDWKHIAGRVRRAVEDTVSAAVPPPPKDSADATHPKASEQLIQDVAPAVLERYVRPLAGAHGGSISITSYRENTVWVYLEGACRGCPAATFTLQQRFERELARRVPGARVREDRAPGEPAKS